MSPSTEQGWSVRRCLVVCSSFLVQIARWACDCHLQVLSAQLLLDSIRGYNALAELAPLCPTIAAAEDAAAVDLPALLSVQWSDCNVPTLQPIPFDAGAQRSMIWHSIWLHQPPVYKHNVDVSVESERGRRCTTQQVRAAAMR